MPEFRYVATDANGVEITALAFAESADEAVVDLRQRGLAVHAIEEIEKTEPVRTARSLPGAPPPPPRSAAGHVPSPVSQGSRSIWGATVIVALIVLGMFLSTDFNSAAVVLVPVILTPTIVIIIVRRWMVARRLERTVTSGTAAIGTILDDPRPSGSVTTIQYGFTTPAGEFHNYVKTIDEEALDYRSGDKVWVIYDPDDPRQNSMWW